MSCLRCTVPTVPELAEFEPAAELLCREHLRDFVRAKRASERRKVYQASRVFCACGNEKYLDRPGPCERCRLGLGPPPPAHVPQVIAPIVSDAPQRMKITGCYGDGGRCPKPGQLYPGGSYCGAPHTPPHPYWIQLTP